MKLTSGQSVISWHCTCRWSYACGRIM